MIPEKNDSRWEEVVATSKEYPLGALAAKMLLMRVRTMVKLDHSPAKIEEAVGIAHDFFAKNEEMLKGDLNILFEKK